MMSIGAFWDWFYELRDVFYDIQSFSEREQAYYYQALSNRLEAFGPTVSYVIKFGVSESLAELTLTSNGSPEGVVLIQNLVAMAPDIPKWQIIAFIQPTLDIDMLIERTDAPYHFDGVSIKASDIVWMPDFIEPDTGKYGLLFGFINLASALQTIPIERVNDYITTILLDLLGEFTTSKKICAVNYEFLKGQVYDEWLGLHDLPLYLE